MRVGITGANGFIGTHFVGHVLKLGHQPVLLLQRGTSAAALAEYEGRVDIVWGDITDSASLDPFLAGCEVVFHLAGYNRYWSKDTEIFRLVNHIGARNIAEGCLKHGVRRLVHVSSCITLGASDDPSPRTEDTGFNLQWIRFPYAHTKKAGEDEIIEWVRTRGLDAVIINPSSAIGEKDYGPTPIGKPIDDICKGLWPVYVAGGACFIDVHDVLRGLWLALEKGRKGEKYVLAGENLTNQQFMSAVAEAAGRPAPKLKVPKPLLGVVAHAGEFLADTITHKHPPLTIGMSSLIGRYLWFDGTKAREELGFVAGPVRPAIQRAVDWFKAEAASAGH